MRILSLFSDLAVFLEFRLLGCLVKCVLLGLVQKLHVEGIVESSRGTTMVRHSVTQRSSSSIEFLFMLKVCHVKELIHLLELLVSLFEVANLSSLLFNQASHLIMIKKS